MDTIAAGWENERESSESSDMARVWFPRRLYMLGQCFAQQMLGWTSVQPDIKFNLTFFSWADGWIRQHNYFCTSLRNSTSFGKIKLFPANYYSFNFLNNSIPNSRSFMREKAKISQ